MRNVGSHSAVGVLWIALLALTCTGCFGSADPLNRQAVSGEVLLNDKALETGSIAFDPVNPAEGRPGGVSIEGGKFDLPKERGLPPGTYTVRVSSPDTKGEPVDAPEAPGESRMVTPDRVPASWNSKSDHTVTIEEGGENHFTLSIP